MKERCEDKNLPQWQVNSKGNIILQALFSGLAAFSLVSAGLAVSYYYDDSSQVNKTENKGLLQHLKTSLINEKNPSQSLLKKEKTEALTILKNNQYPTILGELSAEVLAKEEENSQVLGISSTNTIQAKQNQGQYFLSIKNNSITSKEIENKTIDSKNIKTGEINSRTIEDKSIRSKDLSSRLTIHTLRVGNSSDRPSHFDLGRGDLYIKSNLEVDGKAYFDSTIYVKDSSSIIIGGATSTYTHIDGINDLYIKDDLEVGGTIYGTISGSYVPSGDLDMKTHIITNIGNSNTDFTNTGGLNLAGNLAVNTSQFYVDTSSGNVGIGTTAPGAKLEVRGEVRISDASDERLKLSHSNSDGYSIINNDAGWGGIKFQSNGSDIVTFMNTGNVGIGSTTPLPRTRSHR